MFTNILVAVDGSDPAYKAADIAADLAHRYSATLVVVHVLARVPVPTEGGDLSQVAIAKQQRKAGDDVVAEASKRAHTRGVQAVETVVEEGDPAKTIVDLGSRRNVDLIVMGTRGLGRLQGIILGSVAHKVTHLATCPVLTVR
jgi:nucleotide-binding universal stress UspA family protein